MSEIKRYDPVRTKKGAAFCGLAVCLFDSLDGTPHANVEATDERFQRSIHVYPLAQLEIDLRSPAP